MGKLNDILEKQHYSDAELLSILNTCKSKADFFKAFNLAGGPTDYKELETLCKRIGYDMALLKKEKRHCLTCGKELKKGQTKFCCQSCSATFNNKKRSKTPPKQPKEIPAYKSLTKEDLEKFLFEENLSLNYVGKLYKTGYRAIKNLAKNLGVDLSNYKPKIVQHSVEMKMCKFCGKQVKHNGNIFCSAKCSNEFKKKEKYDYYLNHQDEFIGREINYNWLKKIMLEQQNHKCSICGTSDKWNGKELHFIMDHINGDATNNSADNLRLICPNCDSQLDTYKSKNKGKSTRKYKPYKLGKMLS